MKGAIIPIFMLLITTCFTTKMVSCEPEVPCDFGSGDNNNWSGLKSTVSLSDGRRTGDRYTANNDEDIVSFSTTLWKKFQGDAIFSLYTPFVLSLAAGNLPEDSFENYKTQDSYYLIAYYKAYKITTIYTDVDEKIKEKCERSAKKYNSTAVIPEGLPHATQNYMNFLINTASGTVEELENVSVQQPKIPAFTLTAMTPCNRLYACLGKKLKEVVVSLLENPYKDWIEENASNHTQQSTRATEGLVDGASVKMAPEERDVVEKLYKHGMKHEFEFFQSQLPKDQNAVIVPLSQKLKHDNRKLMISVDANAILAGDTYVSSGYESLFQTQVLKYAGDFSLNKKGGKLTEDLLQTAKKSMEDIKNKVVESIGEVILQPYGLNFFEKVLLNKEENISIYVIPSGDKEGTNVQANQLNNDDDKNLTAFIGSSVDNWSQLCNAKIGIVIGLNSELKKKGDDNGISFVPLFNGLVDIQSKYHAGSTPLPWKPNVLYTISSWAEIDAFILGYY